ncbi:MAG: DUF2007 domain-containing protein [Nitrospirae bacterium]|nr:DUF2007 domain-containing protein [Nitrospirota bacterium]
MDEWTELFFTYDNIEAEIVKDLLEAEKIQVIVESQKISPYPVNIGRMGEIRLLVRNEDMEKAGNILSVMKQTTENNINDN